MVLKQLGIHTENNKPHPYLFSWKNIDYKF